MKVLSLTLYKQWFEEIAEGTKTEEYRLAKPYWVKRLQGKEYTEVHFRNGYTRQAPFMRVECRGIDLKDGVFIIRLGKILAVTRTPEERLWNEIYRGAK